MLEYDGGVGNEGPEVVGLETGVALEVLEERHLVSVVVRVCTKASVSTPRVCWTRGWTYMTASPT